MLESERETARKHEATLLAKVSEYEAAVAELRESTLAAFGEEQRAADGALPKLQERLESAARAHERKAAELLAMSEEKLSMQVSLLGPHMGHGTLPGPWDPTLSHGTPPEPMGVPPPTRDP